MLASTIEQPIHLLLSDVLMPGMRGPELARRLRERRPALPVVYMSGYSDHAILTSEVLAGAAFLQKPFQAEALLRVVHAAVAAEAPLSSVSTVAGM